MMSGWVALDRPVWRLCEQWIAAETRPMRAAAGRAAAASWDVVGRSTVGQAVAAPRRPGRSAPGDLLPPSPGGGRDRPDSSLPSSPRGQPVRLVPE